MLATWVKTLDWSFCSKYLKFNLDSDVSQGNEIKEPHRGSPIGFSGSGIWLISRPGFGISKEKGDEIRDCNHDRDTGFGNFNRRESGNAALKKPRFGNSRD